MIDEVLLMYNSIQEFLDDWTKESAATLKILAVMTDKSLSQPSWPGGKTLGGLAWHITLSVAETMTQAGFKIQELDEDTVPKNAKEIIKTYKELAELAKKNYGTWADKNLKEPIVVYGMNWTKELVLISTIRHQIHHRGQLSVLLRQAGLKIPGIYGPSKEEWEQMKKQ
jgi:uncharacterized damage-inducible protein DinB